MLVNLSYFAVTEFADEEEGGAVNDDGGSEPQSQFKVDYISDLDEENDADEELVVEEDEDLQEIVRED